MFFNSKMLFMAENSNVIDNVTKHMFCLRFYQVEIFQ